MIYKKHLIYYHYVDAGKGQIMYMYYDVRKESVGFQKDALHIALEGEYQLSSSWRFQKTRPIPDILQHYHATYKRKGKIPRKYAKETEQLNNIIGFLRIVDFYGLWDIKKDFEDFLYNYLIHPCKKRDTPLLVFDAMVAFVYANYATLLYQLEKKFGMALASICIDNDVERWMNVIFYDGEYVTKGIHFRCTNQYEVEGEITFAGRSLPIVSPEIRNHIKKNLKRQFYLSIFVNGSKEFITSKPVIEFTQATGNKKKHTFDFIFVKFSLIAMAKEEQLAIVKKYSQKFHKLVLEVVANNQKFQEMGIPMNCLKISNAVLRSDSILMYTLELKSELLAMEDKMRE